MQQDVQQDVQQCMLSAESVASFPGSPPPCVLTLELCTHSHLRVSSKVKRPLETESLGTRLKPL